MCTFTSRKILFVGRKKDVYYDENKRKTASNSV